jgi:hypothetical protein
MITCTFLSTAALEVLKQVSRKVAFSCKKSWSASKVVDEDIAIASAVSSRWSPTVGGFTIEGFRPSISSLVQLPRQCTRQGEIESLKSSDATPFVIRSGVVTMVVVFVPLSVERRAGGVHLAVEKGCLDFLLHTRVCQVLQCDPLDVELSNSGYSSECRQDYSGYSASGIIVTTSRKIHIALPTGQ